MAIGTATITTQGNLYIVHWMNVGSFIRCTPRAFHTEAEAQKFCRDLSLRVR